MKEGVEEFLTSIEFAQKNTEVAAKAVKDFKSSDELHDIHASDMLFVGEQLVTRIHRHIPGLNLDFLYEPHFDDKDSHVCGENGEGSDGVEGADGGKDDGGNEA